MSYVVLPLKIDFLTWAAQIKQDLPNISIPIADSIEGWREWASQVVDINEFSYIPIPTKLAYPNIDDWRIWASYFVDSIYNRIN